MFGISRNPQIEERRAMIVGQMVQQKGEQGVLRDPALRRHGRPAPRPAPRAGGAADGVRDARRDGPGPRARDGG